MKLKTAAEKCNARLVAVSKTKPIERLQEAYDAGQRIFGENRVEELRVKEPALPKDIEWHMIGGLQSKKVRHIAPYISLIHSVDRIELLAEINKRAIQHDRTIDCLLQMHIAQESTKQGFAEGDLKTLIQEGDLDTFQNVRICGLMGMATFTDDMSQVRKEFKELKRIFDELKQNVFSKEPGFKEISMGMSGDYKIALEEGSTLIRVGSLIFGQR